MWDKIKAFLKKKDVEGGSILHFPESALWA